MKRWHKVTTNELSEIRQQQREQGICYNGCTTDALLILYGVGSVKHVHGRGWYVLRS